MGAPPLVGKEYAGHRNRTMLLIAYYNALGNRFASVWGIKHAATKLSI